MDDFTFIEDEGGKPKDLFGDFHSFTSGKGTDLDVQIVTALRAKHPDLIVTTVPTGNCNLLQFAAAGFATADLDEDAEPVIRWRGFSGPSHRGGSGSLVQSIWFAKFNYTWNSENFIFYSIVVGNGSPEFADALKKTRPDQIVIDLFRLKVDRAEVPAASGGQGCSG